MVCRNDFLEERLKGQVSTYMAVHPVTTTGSHRSRVLSVCFCMADAERGFSFGFTTYFVYRFFFSEFEKLWFMRVVNCWRASERDLGIKHSDIKVSDVTTGYGDKVICIPLKYIFLNLINIHMYISRLIFWILTAVTRWILSAGMKLPTFFRNVGNLLRSLVIPVHAQEIPSLNTRSETKYFIMKFSWYSLILLWKYQYGSLNYATADFSRAFSNSILICVI